MNTAQSIQVGVAGPTAWVRVTGRGTFQNSAGLRDFAAEMTKRGHRDFAVDLRDCELMDSTFMGTLAGMALKLGSDGKVRIMRANARNRDVLKNLGLDRILSLEETGPEAPEPLKEAVGRPAHEAERDTIIEAHENLAAANPENAVRFKDVLEFLKQKEPGEENAP